jgi:hypothetical protein
MAGWFIRGESFFHFLKKELAITNLIIILITMNIMKNQDTLSAKFVTELSVIDPDSKLPVEVCIFKNEGGAMFGVDSSYLEQEVGVCYDPFEGKPLEGEDYFVSINES